ncbi:MAG: bifunctional DNA primase/polymerase [Fimbriimonadaceae bacterium]|nr:bifunctional DNA primase/polymerase [Alphaproteobacteria bacterium]
MDENIFKDWAPTFRGRGLEPRPVMPGGKACKVKGWQKPDTETDQVELEKWLTKYPAHGIGLRMGTPLPGGGKLGALDIDRDDYVRLGRALLGNPSCGRFGSKGAVFFVRVIGDLGNPKFKIKGSQQAVVECLFDGTFCVIPPTIHPDTNEAYRWIGTPLHKLDFNNLPVIGE